MLPEGKTFEQVEAERGFPSIYPFLPLLSLPLPLSLSLSLSLFSVIPLPSSLHEVLNFFVFFQVARQPRFLIEQC